MKLSDASSTATPQLLTASDLGLGSTAPPLAIASITEVENVNCLVADAHLAFAAKGLTVVYGANGSGKTGFIRILRTACRSRVPDVERRKVLSNVYGSTPGKQRAMITVDTASGSRSYEWTDAHAAVEDLLNIAVFDRRAADLYVDEGNQIAFLPFNLDLLFRLNELVLRMRTTIERERKVVTEHLALSGLVWVPVRDTTAQKFFRGITGTTTDAEIEAATPWSDKHDKDLADVRQALTGGTARAADLAALGDWLSSTAQASSGLSVALADSNVSLLHRLHVAAIAAREAATIAARIGFSKEPLAGIGSPAWLWLWDAARNYSTAEGYPGHSFPVVAPLPDKSQPRCVLCQQELMPEARDRLRRFEDFVADRLNAEAHEAEEARDAAVSNLSDLSKTHGTLDAKRLEQVEGRNPALAKNIADAHADLALRLAAVFSAIKASTLELETLPAVRKLPPADITSFVKRLTEEAEAHRAAAHPAARAKLQSRYDELIDGEILGRSRDTLKKRRDLLADDEKYRAAIDHLQTTTITKKANELLDVYLTKTVVDAFNEERRALMIDYLRIHLSRTTDRTGAVFGTSPGKGIKAKPSDVLSEGEQRALALAAFLTEARFSAPTGPLVIDDPISSLDRERSARVAARLVEAASCRQVIVFTHDLVFLQELATVAEDSGVPVATSAVFRTGAGAGLLDPAGEPWKGKDPQKRLNVLRQDFQATVPLHKTSLTTYEMHTKNIYGRLRDVYERAVEEVVFHGVIRRFSHDVRTKELRFVDAPDPLIIRFTAGMDKANTYSHDNPAAVNTPMPDPAEVLGDIDALESLIFEFKAVHKAAEARR